MATMRLSVGHNCSNSITEGSITVSIFALTASGVEDSRRTCHADVIRTCQEQPITACDSPSSGASLSMDENNDLFAQTPVPATPERQASRTQQKANVVRDSSDGYSAAD